MPFILFCCLIADARTSNTMLNSSGKSGHPCCVPDLRGKVLRFSLLRMISAVGLSYMAFIRFRYFTSITNFLRVFYEERVLHFVKCFFWIYWQDHMVLILYSINVMYHIGLFVKLKQSYSPGMNPTWSWWKIILMYCWIRVVSISLRFFASMSIRDIGL